MVGTIVAMGLSGVLCSVEFDNGWPLIFYIFGKNVLRITVSGYIDIITYQEQPHLIAGLYQVTYFTYVVAIV